jgi:hypothetical protein
MVSRSGSDLATEIRQDAIDASLEAEARLQRQFVQICANCMKHLESELLCRSDILGRNPKAATPAESLQYWRGHSGNELPHIVRLFSPIIEGGAQPIFAAISLATESAGSTLFIPVPYELLRSRPANFEAGLWINCEPSSTSRFAEDPKLVEDAVRTLSHALTNISYAARINDKPIRAWLARAHFEGKAMYLPDVASLREAYTTEVISVSVLDEPYLGMASVLYFPICDDVVVESKAEETTAEAVIMLWSPIPGRWNGIFDEEGSRYEKANAFAIPNYQPLRRYLWKQLSWLSTIVSRGRSDVRKSELEVFSFLLAFQDWATSRGAETLKQFKDFFHGSLDIVRSHDEVSKLSVRQWIDDLVRDSHGFVKELEKTWKRRLDDATIQLELWDRPKQPVRARLWPRDHEYQQFISSIPAETEIRFSRETAGYIAAEPANNISRYAKSLKQIQIMLTQKFVTLHYVEIPAEKHRSSLVGTHDAFRRYYAGRRGLLAVPPTSGEQATINRGRGHGLWLYRVFEARAQVSRKLYVSANGDTWYTDIVVPLCERAAADG